MQSSKHNYGLIGIVLVLILIVSPLVSALWDDASFPYRKSINVNNAGPDTLRKDYTLTVSGWDTTDPLLYNQTMPYNFETYCNGNLMNKLIGNETDLMLSPLIKMYADNTGWGTTNTTFLLKYPANVSAASSDTARCFNYYGNLSYNSTYTNESEIALFYDSFTRASSVLANGWTISAFWIIANGIEAQIDNDYATHPLDVGACYDCESYEYLTHFQRNNAAAGANTRICFSDGADSNCVDASLNGSMISIETGGAELNINNVTNGLNIKQDRFWWNDLWANISIDVVAFNDISRGDYVATTNGTFLDWDISNITSGTQTGYRNNVGLSFNKNAERLDYIMLKRFLDTPPTVTITDESTDSPYTYETTVYNDPIDELKNNTIYNNVTTGEYITDLDVILTWNSTNYTTTKTVYNSTLYGFEVTILAPNVETSTTKDFFWNYEWTNGSATDYGYSNNYTQTINPLVIENCSVAGSGQVMIYNFTFWDETDNSNLSSIDFEATFNISGGGTSETQTYNYDFDNVEMVGICINNSEDYYATAMLEYFGTGYDIRNYYLYNSPVGNETNSIGLYLLNTTYATGIQFTVTDNLGTVKEGAYIKIQRYDVGTDTYRTIAMGRTDNNGQDYIYLRQADAWYRFIVEENGAVVLMTDPQKITTTTINLIVTSGTSDFLSIFNGISSNISYEPESNAFVLFYDDPSGSAHNFCFEIWQSSYINGTRINNSCLTSSSGTINLTIANQTGTYIARFYAEINPTSILETLEIVISTTQELFERIGIDGIFYAFLFILTAAFVAYWSPSASIFMVTAMTILMAVAGIISLSWELCVGLAVLGGLAIWVVKT